MYIGHNLKNMILFSPLWLLEVDGDISGGWTETRLASTKHFRQNWGDASQSKSLSLTVVGKGALMWGYLEGLQCVCASIVTAKFTDGQYRLRTSRGCESFFFFFLPKTHAVTRCSLKAVRNFRRVFIQKDLHTICTICPDKRGHVHDEIAATVSASV